MGGMSTRSRLSVVHPEPHVLPESPDVYRTLLESTRAIPWKIDWASMRFAYIGPQIETLLGWEPGSWQTVDDWVARMHPDDRDRVVGFCVSQSRAMGPTVRVTWRLRLLAASPPSRTCFGTRRASPTEASATMR